MENQENEEIEKKYCTDCGAEIEEGDEIYTLPNGDIICQNCFESDYTTCDNCLGIIPISEGVTIKDRNGDLYAIYCEDCANDNAFYCEDCQEYYNDDSYGVYDHDGNFICSNCSDNYFTCDNCGGVYHIDDMNESNDGNYYCPDCYEEQDEGDRFLHAYHDFDEWEFYKEQDEDEPPFYIGFELEIENSHGGGYMGDAVEIITNNLNAICMHDGSLDDTRH